MSHQTSIGSNIGYDLINDFLINQSGDAEPNSNDTNHKLQQLRVKLQCFFWDPIQKWRHKNIRPWKLIVQILKLIIFTYQVILFGSDMSKFITYKDEMQTTFKLLFLKEWDPSADALAYPGPYIPYAVYTRPAFFESINYAVKVYESIDTLSVGQFGYKSNQFGIHPIEFCVTNYQRADFDPSNFTYNYSLSTTTKCESIINLPNPAHWPTDFDIRKYLNMTINFSTMISTTMKLPLRTLLIEDATNGSDGLVCFEIDLEIFYDNGHKDGQILIKLETNPRRAKCHGSLVGSTGYSTIWRITNALVLSLSILSSILCARSLWRGYLLSLKTVNLMKLKQRTLTWQDRIEFFDSWLVLIIINDIMIATATVFISFCDERLLETDNYTICSILMGLGNFLSWSGLLRYLGFFKKYNVLLVTLRKSFSHVLRFMFCTTIIYCGFCFCGWIVFGPYHFKFRQLSTTTECLFSLINGDDMFETFALLRSDITSIWWFSRIYLYVFVSLFIYVVLSLFIALIMDAYEIIKQYSDNGFPKTPLQSFYIDGDLSKLTRLAPA